MADPHDAFVSSLLSMNKRPIKTRASDNLPPPSRSERKHKRKPSSDDKKPPMQPSKKRKHKEVDFFDDLNEPSPAGAGRRQILPYNLSSSDDDDDKNAKANAKRKEQVIDRTKRPAPTTSSLRPKPPMMTEEDLRRSFSEIVKSKVTVEESRAMMGGGVTTSKLKLEDKAKGSVAAVVGRTGVSRGSGVQKGTLKALRASGGPPPQLKASSNGNPGQGKGGRSQIDDKKVAEQRPIAQSQVKKLLRSPAGVQKEPVSRGEKSSRASLSQSSIRSFYPKTQPELLEKRYAGIFGIEPEEEEWDSEDEAFIASDDDQVDGLEDEEEDWRAEIKKITRYDPKAFGHIDRGSDRAMEASRQEIEAEERRSRKLAQKEDAEAEREERERQRRKSEARKKSS